MSLAFKRMFLGPGKTFAVPMSAGARVRVIDGMVWATTSSNPDDIWLGAGDEHMVQKRGLTVIESMARSTVDLVPPPATRFRGYIADRFAAALFRTAALIMTVITVGLLVVLPAKMASDGRAAGTPDASNVVTATPTGFVASQPRGVRPLEQTIVQASGGTAPRTSVQ